MKTLLISSFLSAFLIFISSFNTMPVSTISICGTVLDEHGTPLIGAKVQEAHTKNMVMTDIDGNFEIFVQRIPTKLSFHYTGYKTKHVRCKNTNKLIVKMDEPDNDFEDVILAKSKRGDQELRNAPVSIEMDVLDRNMNASSVPMKKYRECKISEQNNYDVINENQFKNPTKDPLSTLSIDVDRASYANVRRFLNTGQFPPADAVRIEEMINYFDYGYAYTKQKKDRPFQTYSELAPCAWNKEHRILKIGLKAQKMERTEEIANNLVFLIDVSGSMKAPNKLPLLKSAFKLLVDQMNESDKISIVVYAGAAGVVLEPTSDANKILEALNNLRAGGSTAGGAGIQLAYKLAKEHFVKDGNNRVILATDGDFNVGTTGDEALIRLIESKRDDGIFLSILGFGTGNYKEGKMQKISNAGNGNHNYIDNMREAKKVLMDEFSGTLYTIAKDVKIQVEFNPSAIEGYRMIGYENRVLAAEDFNNDKKDAGEMGADHTVTVLYEIIPKGAKSSYNVSIDPLKYQEKNAQKSQKWANELGTIKYRYKKPTADSSIKSEEIIYNRKMKDLDISPSTEWASYVAEFGLLLRNSSFKGSADYDRLIKNIKQHLTSHPDLYKQEMLDLVILAKSLQPHNQ